MVYHKNKFTEILILSTGTKSHGIVNKADYSIKRTSK